MFSATGTIHRWYFPNLYNKEPAQVPIDTEMDKKVCYIYTPEFCSAIKNEVICRKMDRTGDSILSEKSQTQKDKYQVFSHLWKLRGGGTRSSKQKTDYWGGERERERWGEGKKTLDTRQGEQ
jgi:hypothetical protein